MRSAAGFRHPSIITIFEARLDCVPRYFVMEHVAGRSLKSILEAEGPLPAARVQEILSDVGGALAYSHWKGFLHQNVTTANVMIDAKGRALMSALPNPQDLRPPNEQRHPEMTGRTERPSPNPKGRGKSAHPGPAVP